MTAKKYTNEEIEQYLDEVKDGSVYNGSNPICTEPYAIIRQLLEQVRELESDVDELVRNSVLEMRVRLGETDV